LVGEIRALIKNLTAKVDWAAKFDCATQRQVLTTLGIDQTVLQQSAVEMRATLIKNLAELAKIDCAALQREIVAKLCDTDAALEARSAKVIYDIIDKEVQERQKTNRFCPKHPRHGQRNPPKGDGGHQEAARGTGP